MLNKIFLQGRLVADPELRHTQSGVAVATFRIAVDRDFKDRETGEKKADFISVVAWRQTAEFICKYLGTKGSEMILEGREVTEKWTDQNGAEKSFDVLYVDHAHFCGKKAEGQQTAQQAQPSTPAGFVPVGDDSDLPF